MKVIRPVRNLLVLCVLTVLCLGLVPHAMAEEPVEDTVESTIGATPEQQSEASALAKTIQNPIAALVSLPFQYNINYGVGEFERVQATLNIQPVIPFKLAKGAHLITRTIIPVTSIPVGEVASEFGFGDIQWSGFYSPKTKGNISWGVGAQLNLPTASNEALLGSGKISAGPAGVLFWGKGKWTAGGIASNVWSVIDIKDAGRFDQPDVNFFFAQWFVNYNFGKGLALGTAPIITCDWNYETSGSGDDRCTFPLGLQVSKVTFAGSQPLNLLLGYYNNITHPEGGADSQWRLQVNFMFPVKNKK